MDLVQSLVDKSFVRQIGDDRLDLLQSVQEYASQHLRTEGRFEGSGPSAALRTEVRHAAYFSALGEDEVTARATLELDNLAAACRRAAVRGDCAGATRTLALAWAVLELRGPFQVGLELSSLVLALPGLPLPYLAKVRLVHGRASRALGRYGEARSSFEAALHAARESNDRRCEAEAHSKLGYLKSNTGRLEEASVDFKSGLELARQIDDPALECELRNGLGTLHDYAGRLDAALVEYQAALALARRLGNRRWEGGVLGNMGNVYYSKGDIRLAQSSYEAGLVIARDLGNRQWEGDALCNLGLLHQVEGNVRQSLECLERSLHIARQMGHARLEAIALCNLGIAESDAGNLHPARSHFESSIAIAEASGDRRTQGQTLGYLGLLHYRLGDSGRGQQLLDTGRRLLEELQDSASLVVLLCCSAEGRMAAGEREAALEQRAKAMQIAEGFGPGLTYDVKVAIERADRAALPSAASATRC